MTVKISQGNINIFAIMKHLCLIDVLRNESRSLISLEVSKPMVTHTKSSSTAMPIATFFLSSLVQSKPIDKICKKLNSFEGKLKTLHTGLSFTTWETYFK